MLLTANACIALSVPRTNISIADDVADELSSEAMKRNKTLYAFANESLTAVISVCKLSGEPREVLHSWRMARMLKDVEAVPLPGDLVEKMLKKLYETDQTWLLKTWFAEGARLASYLRMAYEELPSLAQAAVEFQGVLPLRRLEFRSIEEGETKGGLLLRALGAGLSAESTACAEQLIRGIVDSYSWAVVSSRTAEGILELQLSRRKR